ncbi:MAG TPA: SMC-Scp complex subunit ScpB [Fimbriimonas sp.]|nr:SMC-Scp complex subunit ScpB [Fimbriimonas sp.]
MMDVVESLHALLFVADSPASVQQFALALGLTEGQVDQAMEVLRERLCASGPVQIVQLAGGYQLATKPEFQPVVTEFLKPQRQRLSRSLLEVLAIVAYRQPVTVGEIDAVRGVQSDHAIRTLLERRLIQEIGKKPVPGRPNLYGTTSQFLHVFNLNDLSQLPALKLENAQNNQEAFAIEG